MPAGTIELYKPPRKRYTVIEENSIESINQEYYGNPHSKDIRRKYYRYFLSHEIDVDDLYYKHNNTKARQEIWRSLPPDVRRSFHEMFDLQGPKNSKVLVVKRIYR